MDESRALLSCKTVGRLTMPSEEEGCAVAPGLAPVVAPAEEGEEGPSPIVMTVTAWSCKRSKRGIKFHSCPCPFLALPRIKVVSYKPLMSCQ